MAAPDLDTNQWYTMYINNNNDSSLRGSKPQIRGGTTGATCFIKTNPNGAAQRWQIFPINSTTFVLRTQEGGANAFIGTRAADDNGIISSLMLRGDVADESVYWGLGSWGDGTWFLWNGGNGTGYHLSRNGAGAAMDNNITAPQNRQRWKFNGVARIDDEAYSSVNVSAANGFELGEGGDGHENRLTKIYLDSFSALHSRPQRQRALRPRPLPQAHMQLHHPPPRASRQQAKPDSAPASGSQPSSRSWSSVSSTAADASEIASPHRRTWRTNRTKGSRRARSRLLLLCREQRPGISSMSLIMGIRAQSMRCRVRRWRRPMREVTRGRRS